MSTFSNRASDSPEERAAYAGAVLDLLGEDEPLAVLRATPSRLADAVAGVPPQVLRTPEADGRWSVAQVLQHLADSDLVWSWRLRVILAQDRPPITGYDQDLWAERLHYADADPQEALELFRVVRAANVRVVARATPDELRRTGVHSERGEESLELLCRLYAGHDRLHLNQVARILGVVR